MSRLIVKNIPSYVTNEALKTHFLQKNGPGGNITDIKVALKADGTSRRFAFVGYKSDDEAVKAQQWFDRTYIDTTRINVQVAEVHWRAFFSSFFFFRNRSFVGSRLTLLPCTEGCEGCTYS